MDLGNIISFPTWNSLPPELFSSVITMLVLVGLSLAVYFRVRHYDPLQKPKGIVHLAEICVQFADKQVKELMGTPFDGYGGYIMALGLYIFIGFVFGMVGLPNLLQPGSSGFLKPLPNPFTNTAMTLSIAFITFFLIHLTAIRVNHWAYFKRFAKPFAVFLPINLITMWSPVLSMALRLFGNALAGYFVLTLIYVGFSGLFNTTIAGLALAPLIAPVAHLYFDLFDSLIQTTVFCMLTMLYISQEYVAPEDLAKAREARAQQRSEKKTARAKKAAQRKRRALEI